MTDDRARSLLEKFGSRDEAGQMPDAERAAWIARRVSPSTLDEYEWSIMVRPNIARIALEPFRRARESIERLQQLGWTNHGWYNASPIGMLVPEPGHLMLSTLVEGFRASGAQHEIVAFWFGDDDTRAFVLTPPVATAPQVTE